LNGIQEVSGSIPLISTTKRNPPAKPGVLHRRAKPYVTSKRVSSRKYGLTPARDLLLATRKRA